MEICFKACFGDKISKVVLSPPNGAGTDNYHIMVDDYYHGVAFKREGQWVVYLNERLNYTTEDAQVIIEILDENHCQKNNV